MKRTILVIEHVTLWLVTWIVITLLMYYMGIIILGVDHKTFISCSYDKLTVSSQLCIGWMIPYMLLYDKRKQLLV